MYRRGWEWLPIHGLARAKPFPELWRVVAKYAALCGVMGSTDSILADRSPANSTRWSALILAIIPVAFDTLPGWCDNPRVANGGAGVFPGQPQFRTPTARPLTPANMRRDSLLAVVLAKGPTGPPSGINAAAHNLGIDRTEAPFPSLVHRPHAAPQHYHQSCIGPSTNYRSRTSRPTMDGEFR